MLVVAAVTLSHYFPFYNVSKTYCMRARFMFVFIEYPLYKVHLLCKSLQYKQFGEDPVGIKQSIVSLTATRSCCGQCFGFIHCCLFLKWWVVGGRQKLQAKNGTGGFAVGVA